MCAMITECVTVCVFSTHAMCIGEPTPLFLCLQILYIYSSLFHSSTEVCQPMQLFSYYRQLCYQSGVDYSLKPVTMK
jgi:hypothetical protein